MNLFCGLFYTDRVTREMNLKSTGRKEPQLLNHSDIQVISTPRS